MSFTRISSFAGPAMAQTTEATGTPMKAYCFLRPFLGTLHPLLAHLGLFTIGRL